MAENKDGGEKTEQPTGKKLADARRKGQVPLTRELPPLFVLLGGVGVISLWAPQMLRQFAGHFRQWLEQIGTLQIDSNSLYVLLLTITTDAFVPLIPFGLLVAAFALTAILMQTGPLWIEEGLQPKPSKMNPMNGLKRIFSWKGVVDLLKSLLKLAMVSGILYFVLSDGMVQLIQFPMLSLFEAMSKTWMFVEDIVWFVGGALLMLAIGDFVYQRWQHNEDLKMTKQEVKDESKDVEGDPQIRSRRLSLQRERSRQRMLQAVPKADVVITNPTHLAVALRYDTENMDAPMVVAKGAGFMAEKIKQIARHAGVPILENRSLARGIFKGTKVGQEIPAALYQAAAEILAYVYRLRNAQNQTA
ncbi:MAG: flagellar biosynthesis protein FlhB [Nitrospirota bacterium]|nr:flagellar biosynthesis protein FlhB [Nitrospirota bacterium]